MPFIDVKLVWKDNSSGVRDETGQEIDIYTDSPSFKPAAPINYADTNHPWMRLPAIAAGEVEAVVPLELPVTFVKFRIRQYNANGAGEWSQAVNIPIDNPTGINAPQAPTELGGAVVTAGDPPPPPPTEPPPPPPPTGGGGASSNYNYAQQFSGVQGQNQWKYFDENDVELVFSAPNNLYNGLQPYQGAWPGGIHPGTTVGTKIRYTAPANGTALVSGFSQLVQASNGVTRTIKKNAATIDGPTSQTTTAQLAISETVVMVAGDYIDFLFEPNSGNTNCSVIIDIVIQFTTDGTTPQNPVVASLTPSALDMSIGGVGALTVALSSPAIENATISLSSSDAGKATVPATVVIPLGQMSVVIPVTGIATGSSTITATYNSTSKQSTATVSAPVSTAWTNAPQGGVVLFDHNFTTILGAGMTGGGSNIRLDTDPSAPTSPPNCYVSRLELNTNSGGSQLEMYAPAGMKFKELYVGLMWRTNAQWTGRKTGDKMVFLRGPNSNGLIGLKGGIIKGGNPYVEFSHNSGNVDNSHIMQEDRGLVAGPNVGSSVIVPGVWTKIEFWIRHSTTLTSRDGVVKWWVNSVLAGYYEGMNYGTVEAGLTNCIFTETWDGSGIPAHTAPLEHWLDHIYVVGKN